jgi:hypothetical protein
MEKRLCKKCRQLFKVRPQIPNQKYCSQKKCQRARKNVWQKAKIRTDKAYRQNQKEAQKRWHKSNPEYYQNYRKKNPEYTAKNRLAQAERNRRKRSVSGLKSIYDVIAEMDLSSNKISIKSGRYTIISADNPKFAKMDVIIADISTKTNY